MNLFTAAILEIYKIRFWFRYTAKMFHTPNVYWISHKFQKLKFLKNKTSRKLEKKASMIIDIFSSTLCPEISTILTHSIITQITFIVIHYVYKLNLITSETEELLKSV